MKKWRNPVKSPVQKNWAEIFVIYFIVIFAVFVKLSVEILRIAAPRGRWPRWTFAEALMSIDSSRWPTMSNTRIRAFFAFVRLIARMLFE